MLHTDNELLRLIGEDNEEAFSFLYKRYWEELFIVAARALRSNN